MIGSLPRRCGSMTTVWLKASLSAAVDGAATRAPARPTSATAEPRTAGLLRGRTCRLQTVVGSSATSFAAQPAFPSARRVNHMTTVVLVRHGLTAMTGPVLAGWTPGLHLDERGQKQAIAVAERLRGALRRPRVQPARPLPRHHGCYCRGPGRRGAGRGPARRVQVRRLD